MQIDTEGERCWGVDFLLKGSTRNQKHKNKGKTGRFQGHEYQALPILQKWLG